VDQTTQEVATVPQQQWSRKHERQHGGLRSHSGSGGRTTEQLYAEARRQNVKGRSSMTKAELGRAVGR
jgi:hypothetical protein